MSEQEPHTVTLQRRVLNLRDWRREALESDYASLITEPTRVYDADARALTLVYLALEDDFTDLVSALRRLDIRRRTRTGGMRSLSREFGSHPRNRLKNNFCGPASLARDDTQAHRALSSAALVVAAAYGKYNPTLASRHERLAKAVRPEWHLEGTAFTSGIVNRDSALPYHFDTGNFKGVWSGMLGFRRDVTGGYLAVPEYDLGFEIADRSLLMFDGQGLLHGVTPFAKTSPQGYRFTVVYYSLDQMWRCLAPGEEAKRSHR